MGKNTSVSHGPWETDGENWEAIRDGEPRNCQVQCDTKLNEALKGKWSRSQSVSKQCPVGFHNILTFRSQIASSVVIQKGQ